MLKIKEVLDKSTVYLKQRSIPSPRLDAEILLAHVLKTDRLRIYLDFDKPLNELEESLYRELIVRRGKSEPVAYLCGSREFMSLDFLVTPAVLIPRPETELLVEKALQAINQKKLEQPLKIFEVGIGSGAISVSLAVLLQKQMPGLDFKIIASDISRSAMEIAAENAKRHQVENRITMFEADLFGETEEQFDFILSNPPYVDQKDIDSIAPDVKNFEPHQALFAEDNGCKIIERLIESSAPRLKSNGSLLFEIGINQDNFVNNKAEQIQQYITEAIYPDLQTIPRIAHLIKRNNKSNGS